MFLGWALGSSFMGMIADRYGRKTPYIVCNYLCVIILHISTRITDWKTYCLLTLVYGATQAGSMSVGYVFLTEQLPRNKHQYIIFYEIVD